MVGFERILANGACSTHYYISYTSEIFIAAD